MQYATQAKSKSQVSKKKQSYEHWSDQETYSLGKLSNEKNQRTRDDATQLRGDNSKPF